MSELDTTVGPGGSPVTESGSLKLDHPATQQDKVPVAHRHPARSTLIRPDKRRRCGSLLDHGFAATARGLHSRARLTMYLSEDVVRRQLQLLRKVSAIGSRLAIDFYPPSTAGTGRHHRQLRVQQFARSGSGESIRLALDRSQAVGLVQASGWNIDQVMSLKDAANALVPSETGLPTNAVNEHKTLIAAAHAA